jgi:membrane associated rhomboid family serine protease
MPPVVKNILIINVLLYAASTLLAGGRFDLYQYFSLKWILSPDFHIWQIITYMFMHANFSHLFFNMFAVWMFGAILERTMGAKRFLIYYLVTGIGASIIHFLVMYWQVYPALSYLNYVSVIGASGAVFGILLAFGMMYPNAEIYIYFLVPLKAKWLVLIYGAIELLTGIFGSNDGVAHFAHLGGMLFGFFLLWFWGYFKIGKKRTYL